MLLDSISFELPEWQGPTAEERGGRPEWFDLLFGSDGDGFFLPAPIRFRQQPAELWREN
jgi:hypothetical protein